MAIMQDEDVRFKNLSRKIGWFVLVAGGGLVLMFVGLAMKQELFTPKSHLHFITESGADIKKGMAVKLSGFNIGKVESLALTEDANVMVTLTINNQYMKWVRRDSRARLAKEGLIGDAFVEIPPGSDSEATLRDGDPITFERDEGIGQVVDKLYGQVVPLIQDIRRITQYLDDPNGDVKQSLHRLNTAMTELNTSLTRVDRILAAAEKDVPGTLRTTRETLESSKKVVDSVGKTWPISRNIEPPQAQTIPVDSYHGVPPAPPPAGTPPGTP
jgi:phospholipid/cholesterol/gamma-HCH transport system substrate-binding protein